MELSAALARLDTEGYAPLGRVLGDDGLTALRERAEDLMLGRVADPGLFFQMDARTGQYEDAGLGWRGPSPRQVSKDSLRHLAPTSRLTPCPCSPALAAGDWLVVTSGVRTAWRP